MNRFLIDEDECDVFMELIKDVCLENVIKNYSDLGE